MRKTFFRFAVIGGLTLALASCKSQEFSDQTADVYDVHVDQLSAEMLKVRNYVPKFAVVAHRGSTFWTPEETEASYRWAREMGGDYLECDMQVSKDGVVLALHDDNLKRTTNIENVYGEDVPRTRKAYYVKLGYSDADAQKMYEADKMAFVPNLPSYYTYEELMRLDAGTWFNETSLEQARPGFTTHKQYVSTLEDLVNYSRGKKLVRDGVTGERKYTMAKTNKTVSSLSGKADIVKYTFEYTDDTEGDSGNRPGIYIEFKEPWLNPTGFEQMVYDVLDELGMNVITKPEPDSNPSYVNGKVNVGNTNGKVILQTFSLESLSRVAQIFDGKVPMCFLLWKGTGATDLTYDTPLGYASFINLGIKNKAHIMGPCIAGAPNNYPELNKPWQDYLIKKSGMYNHPYSFDTRDQMSKYWGDYNFGYESDRTFKAPYLDGLFTNRTEMTLQYFIDKKVRGAGAATTVPDPEELLTKLGY